MIDCLQTQLPFFLFQFVLTLPSLFNSSSSLRLLLFLPQMRCVVHLLFLFSLVLFLARNLWQVAFKCERSVNNPSELQEPGGMERRTGVTRGKRQLFTFLKTVLFLLTGWYLVKHLCFRLLIITYPEPSLSSLRSS